MSNYIHYELDGKIVTEGPIDDFQVNHRANELLKSVYHIVISQNKNPNPSLFDGNHND
jgi:hypothetical protein